MEELETAGVARGYRILSGAINRDPRREKYYTDFFLGHRCDGIIIVSSSPTPKEILRAGVPTVLVNAHLAEEPGGVPVVEVDDKHGMRQAVTHLIGMGHRRIAMVGFPTVPLRTAGYCQALEEADIPFDPELLVSTNDMDRPFGALALARALLTQYPDITAVAGGNDMAAMGVLRAAHVCGRRVPDDLAVTGFDNITLGASLVPALTTVAQPVGMIAAHAMDLMLHQIEKGGEWSEGQHVLLSTTLVVRESCGAGPAARTAEPV